MYICNLLSIYDTVNINYKLKLSYIKVYVTSIKKNFIKCLEI